VAAPPTPHTSLIYFFFNYYKMFRGTSPYEPLYNRGGSSGSSAVLLLLLMGLMLLFLMIVVLFLVIYSRRRNSVSKKKYKRLSEKTLTDVKQGVRSSAEAAGLDPDEAEQAFDEQLKEETAKRCMVSPLRAGQCSPNYTLENGCCYPDESTPPHPNAWMADATRDVAIAIGAGAILEVMLAVGLRRAGVGAGARAGAGGAVAGAKAGATGAKAGAAGARAGAAGAKAAASAGKAARAAAAAVRAASAAARAAAATAKYAAAAAAGPAGWVALVVMLVFDAISIALDMTDAGGYASETKNSFLNQMKNIFDYEMAKALEKEEIEYPLLFPLALVYPEQFEAAMDFAIGQVHDQHLVDELLKDDKLVNIVADYNDELEVNPDAEPPEEFINFLIELPAIFHLERDKYLFQKLQELLGTDAYKIEIYETLSTRDRIAVTFSQQGVQEWNESKKDTWFANNDLFKPEDPPPAGEDPLSALYTDTYYVYDSGPSDNPVMVPRRLGEKTALAAVYGPLLSFCEKARKAQSTSPTINPRDLGVRFDFNTGVCNYTKEYCRRYGLEFKNNDCHLREGQYWAELIFGQTITRGVIRAFTSPPSYAKKSKPATKGPCPPGMRDDGINCWLDPVYRGVGKPMGCKNDEEKKGQLCYPKCKIGYTSSALDCEGTCPAGSRDTGLTCLKPIHAYIPGNKCSNPLKKCFYERANCRAGYIYRGTTCNEECPGFNFRSGAAGSAFCDKPRNRYSRAGDAKPLSSCPEGYEKQGLLCYPKCENKGDQGQYTYNGVLDWCQPKGGAGIKKGLDDRWECPEGWKNIAGICYENCKPGESDDGLLCNPP
jgi:hypothetical protein